MSRVERMGDTRHGESLDAAQRARQWRPLHEHARQIKRDADALAGALESAAHDLERHLQGQVDQRPYSTLAVAAGVGYVVGGGLTTRLTNFLSGTATKLAMAMAARLLDEQLSYTGDSEHSSRSERHKRTQRGRTS